MKDIGIILGAIVAVIVSALLAGLIIMYAWNQSMSAIFNLPIITYWQAFWLYVLVAGIIKGGTHSYILTSGD